jgi:phosphate transport system protein
MNSVIETELDTLRERLMIMAGHAETSVNLAVQAVIQRDADLASRVKENDKLINQFEIEIDDLVIHQLTMAPLATDLRLATTAIKISQNLERIGDEAKQIAKRARDLCMEAPVKINLDLPRMAGITLEMLKAALDAFGNHDSVAARAVIPRDKEVDALNKEFHSTLAQYMAGHPDAIIRCLHLMVVSKSLERIADHATNVAEDVVYLWEARDIRHTGARNAPPAIG